MKKVLVITYYWPPSGGAGVQRILKFVKYFREFGIEPYVVTVKEEEASYPYFDDTFTKDIPDKLNVYRTKTSEPFNVYSKLQGKRSIPTGFSNEGKPGTLKKISRFIRGNFYIPDARKGWIDFAFEQASAVIEKEKINTVITTSPPHSVQMVGLKLKKKFKITWITDLRDPWTDIYYYDEFFHLPFARRKDAGYEREVLENADRIVTVSNGLKDLFMTKSARLDAKKFIVIPNGYDESDFTGVIAEKDKGFVITYSGTLSDVYNPQVFFRALKKVRDEFPQVNIRLRFIGSVSPSVIDYMKSISIFSSTEIIPTVDHEQSVKYLLSGSALLLVIPEVKNDKGILTGKLFEYLASGKPIICIGPVEGDAASIIEECKAGKLFGRDMQTKIEDYMRMLVVLHCEGKEVIPDILKVSGYSRRSQAAKLAEIIKET